MSTTLARKALKTYHFTLVFAEVFNELTDELVDAVWEARCNDPTISLRERVLRIAFDREAPSYRGALLSSVADIERTGLGLELASIEPE